MPGAPARLEKPGSSQELLIIRRTASPREPPGRGVGLPPRYKMARDGTAEDGNACRAARVPARLAAALAAVALVAAWRGGAPHGPGVPERRRPGQLRRDGGRQEGRPRHRPDPRRLRGAARTASFRPSRCSRGATRRRRRPRRLHLGLLFDTSGSMEERHRLLAQRRHQVPQRRAGGRGHHAGGLRHRGPGRAVRPARLPAARRADPPRKPDGKTALYDAMGVYLDGAAIEEGRRMLVSTPTAATPAASCRYTRDARPAAGVGHHAVRDRVPRPPVASRRRSSSGCRLRHDGRAHRRPGVLPDGRSRTSTRPTTRSLAEIRAQYTLGYLSTNAQDRRHVAQGRDQGEAARAEGAHAPGATSRRSGKQPVDAVRAIRRAMRHAAIDRPLHPRVRLRTARRPGPRHRRARGGPASAATRTRCCSASPGRARRSPWPRSSRA